jgi:RNA polymerase sigma-70 factor, ECF subfamily
VPHDRRRASDEGLEERFAASERTEVEAARRDEAGEVRAAIQMLPAEQSRVIELAYFGGFTHAEIATMLQTPVGTVKGRMRLGLAKMRHQLGGLAAEASS